MVLFGIELKRFYLPDNSFLFYVLDYVKNSTEIIFIFLITGFKLTNMKIEN